MGLVRTYTRAYGRVLLALPGFVLFLAGVWLSARFHDFSLYFKTGVPDPVAGLWATTTPEGAYVVMLLGLAWLYVTIIR